MPVVRVLHVLDHSLPHLSGYAVRSHYLLRSQRALQMLPVAVTSPKHGSDEKHLMIDGIEYLRTPARADRALKVPLVAEADLMLRLGQHVERVARERKIQLLHAHSPVLNGIPTLRVARRLGIPAIYEIRAFWEDAAVDHGTHREGSARYRLIRALETWVIRRADAVGVISDGLAADVINRGVPPERIYRIPNGVDTEAFVPEPRDRALAERWGLEGATVIGFIGSFCRYEGLDVLVDAFARVVARAPQARLLLVGDGEAKASLRQAAETLGIASKIIFAGRIPHDEIKRCYSVCDVLAYPRRSMRLTELVTPLKPLEAMAAGKAVVASDIGGLRELIRDGDTGVLSPAADAGALADRLAELVAQPDLRRRLGRDARRHVCENRGWRTLTRIYVETYAKLLRSPLATADRLIDENDGNSHDAAAR